MRRLLVRVGELDQPRLLPRPGVEGQSHRESKRIPHRHRDVWITCHRRVPGAVGAAGARIAIDQVDAPGRGTGGGDQCVEGMLGHRFVDSLVTRLTLHVLESLQVDLVIECAFLLRLKKCLLPKEDHLAVGVGGVVFAVWMKLPPNSTSENTVETQ